MTINWNIQNYFICVHSLINNIFFTADKSVKDTESVGVKTNMSVKSEDKKTAVSAFGSITAQLMDGMTMSLSQFGESGTCEEGM